MTTNNRVIIFDFDGTLMSAPGPTIYPGIKELLESLKHERIFLWTLREKSSVQELLSRFSIDGFFSGLCCSDDMKVPKPNTESILKLLGDFQPADSIFIGDSIQDMEGAKNLNCISIAACWGQHTINNKLLRETADFIAKQPNDCLRFINKKHLI